MVLHRFMNGKFLLKSFLVNSDKEQPPIFFN